MTHSSISLSPRSRQRGGRYAIRAGRNLPDKEFRYLRTVIVTAAVYRGFNSELAPLLLTFRHRAGVRPYTSPCGFAEPCVLSKQSPPPGLCPPPAVARRRGLLLPKLRRHFAEFLQRRSLKRLGILYQSTCVGLGYGQYGGLFPGTARRPGQSDKPRQPTRSVTSSWPRNIHLVPIDYAFRPRLRGRLTLLRLALSRNPWTSGDGVSHPVCRYSCQHSRFRTLHRSLPGRLHSRRPVSGAPGGRKRHGALDGTLRYRACLAACTPSFGSWLEPRYIFAAGQLD